MVGGWWYGGVRVVMKKVEEVKVVDIGNGGICGDGCKEEDVVEDVGYGGGG